MHPSSLSYFLWKKSAIPFFLISTSLVIFSNIPGLSAINPPPPSQHTNLPPSNPPASSSSPQNSTINPDDVALYRSLEFAHVYDGKTFHLDAIVTHPCHHGKVFKLACPSKEKIKLHLIDPLKSNQNPCPIRLHYVGGNYQIRVLGPNLMDLRIHGDSYSIYELLPSKTNQAYFTIQSRRVYPLRNDVFVACNEAGHLVLIAWPLSSFIKTFCYFIDLKLVALHDPSLSRFETFPENSLGKTIDRRTISESFYTPPQDQNSTNFALLTTLKNENSSKFQKVRNSVRKWFS